MSEQLHPSTLHNAFVAIARWVDRYRDMLDPMRQFGSCTPDDVRAIAQDLSLTPTELMTLTRKGPDSARLLSQLLIALGVDPKQLAQQDAAMMRDLQRLCVNCGYKRQCEHDLREGTSAAHYAEYCPNAYTLGLLFGNDPTEAGAPEHSAAEQPIRH
jgi:uncharacterized protein DUF6455